MASATFRGIKEAQQMGGNRRLDVGNYTLSIDTVRFFMSRKDNRSPVFAVDFEVLDSDNSSFKKGDKVGYVTKQSQFPQYFLADIKTFIAAAANVSEDEVDEDDADEAVGAEQPLRGRNVRCCVTPGKNEKFPQYRFLAAT